MSLSSSRFHKLVGIAYSSALAIIKKLTMVIQSRMGEEAQDVSSSCFATLLLRRSRETPARQHPRSELKVTDSESLSSSGKHNSVERAEPDPGSSSTLAHVPESSSFVDPGESLQTFRGTGNEECQASVLSELSESEEKVYKLLSAEPAHFDILCEHSGMDTGPMSAALMMLELAGLARGVGNDRYVFAAPFSPFSRCPAEVPEEELLGRMVDVAVIIAFVRATFQGISRKYLQNYLALHWCCLDRSRWRPGSLMRECLHSPSFTYRDIVSYVSPQVVKAVVCLP